MIKTFIFVEDGSVDLDELKSSVGDDVLVIPYRQGATPPAIQQPREPVSRREVNIKDRLLDLMIEFDEMGFAPTTVCENAEGFAVKWKEQVVNEIGRLEAKINTLWHEAKRNADEAIMQKNRADLLKKTNTDLHEELTECFKKVYMDFFSKLNLDKEFRKKFDNVTLGCQIQMFEDELDRTLKEYAPSYPVHDVEISY